jgi:hypothetical protein
MLPPTSSPTTTPITASVAAMRSPAKSGGSDAGYSISRKICMRVAENERARLTMSGSTVRTAVSTLTITGKNTIRIATRIFG